MPYANAPQLIDKLWSLLPDEDTFLYAVLDGARHDLIYPAVLQSECEFECLYLGELEEDLAEAAPYLVKLEPDKPFTEWLFREGWGDSWGIFLQASLPIRDVKRHLRKFLMVYDPSNQPVYFRYYDPRVMRVYLPTCNEKERATVIGALRAYLLEDSDPARLLRFTDENGELRREVIPC